MKTVQRLSLLFEQRHHVAGPRMTGVAAGYEDRIDAGQSAEGVCPFLEGELDCGGNVVSLVLVRTSDTPTSSAFVFQTPKPTSSTLFLDGGTRSVGSAACA